MQYIIHSYRSYGQPKLKKPKELSGIKENFSIDFIPKKCRCKCYILDGDLWIMHRDYFSQSMTLLDEDFGSPLSVLCKKYLDKSKSDKFVYADAWGDIVLRNEAYIHITNFTYNVDKFGVLDTRYEIMLQMANTHRCDWTDIDLEWERFFERIILKYISEKENNYGEKII